MRGDYSLRLRLVAAMSLMFLLGVGGSAVYYYFEAYAVGSHLDERTLQSQARELLAGLTISGPAGVGLSLPDASAEMYAEADSTSFYTLYDDGQRPVARSPNLTAPLPFIAAPASGSFGPLQFIGAGPQQMAVLSVAASNGHTLMVGRTDPDDDALAFSLIEEGSEGLFIVLVPFVVVSLLIVWLITDWSLRPVARASRQAARIGPASPSTRIATRSLPTEIRPLVDAANGAVERLAGAYTAERRLTADAAHELRTPLAVLNLRLQQARMRGLVDWPTVEREIATMNRLVNQLLDLARKESPAHAQAHIGMVPVNLSRIVREAAAMVLPLAEEAGRRIELDAPDGFLIQGHPDDLRDMVRNLLDNALVHGRGVVSVAVRREASPRDGIVIEVEDEGTANLKEELFTRFRKGSAGSPGSGLGLAIVRQVARNHGGDANFIPGSICRIRVFMPIAD